MPTLDGTHILERLVQRLAQLEAGEEIAAKEIRSLLSPEQQKELNDAWAAQKLLRTQQRARTEDEKKALGWKSIRELRIEVYKKAVKTAWTNINAEFEMLNKKANVRQTRIYFDAFNEAKKLDKDDQTAKNWANNELTRAKLRRMDGQIVSYMSKRDKEIFEMEAALRESIRSSITADELEQQAMIEAFDKSLNGEK